MKRTFPFFVVIAGILIIVAAGMSASSSLEAKQSSDLSPRSYLPFVSNETDLFDMADYIVGDGRLYEVWQWIASENRSTQARHQTQFDGPRFYHTKGNEFHAEWEELWMDNDFVYRGTDTSPGSGLYYTLRDGGKYGSKWSPRHWRVGDVYERNPWVTFYHKSDCAVDKEFPHRTWLRFEAYHPEFTLGSGIVVNYVVVLDWLLEPDGPPAERYFYARDFGLVAWQNGHGDYSFVSEVHGQGAREDNSREMIQCLDMGDRPAPAQPDYPLRPFKPPYRAK